MSAEKVKVIKAKGKEIVQRVAKESDIEWHKRQTPHVLEANARLLLYAGVDEQQVFDTIDSIVIAMMGEYGE